MSRPDVPRYSRVSTRFWLDERSASWSDDIKLSALYFMTAPHRTLEGIFLLPVPYASADLRWTAKKVHKAIAFLTAEAFLGFDPKTNTMLLRNALRYQCPENENQAKSCLRRIAALPKTDLLASFLVLANQHCSRKGASPYAQTFYKQLVQLLTQPLSEPLGEPLVPLNLNQNLNLQPKTNILNLQPQSRLTGDEDSFLSEGESEQAVRENRIPRESLEVFLRRTSAGRGNT